MSIGSRELRELGAAIAGTVPRERPATVTRGVVTSSGDVTWVLLDGAESPTPVQASTCAVSPGDQVSVRIQDGSATVTGNVTQPAQTASAVAAAVRPAQTAADDALAGASLALESAKAAQADADRAHVAADQATADAATARAKAEQAIGDAARAKSAADSAQASASTAADNAAASGVAASIAQRAAEAAQAKTERAQADAAAAKAKADRTEQYFYADASGAHVVSSLDSAGKAQGTRLDMSSSGLSIKDAKTLSELASFGANDIYLGNKSDAAIHLRNDGLISAGGVADYEGNEFTAMSVSAPSVELSGASVAALSASEDARTVDGQRLAGYSASVTASGHGELYDPDGDQGRQANPNAWVEMSTSSVPAGTNGGEDGGCGSAVALVSTGDRSYVSVETYVTEADGSRSGGSSVEVANGDVRVLTDELRAEVSGEIGVSAGDVIAISHSTSGRPPMGVGWGADGNNRGISADINGSGNDGFAWLFAVNDSQHWPIIPGLYHGDVGNCSLIPVYTSQKNLGSIKAGSSTTGTMSISRSGYSPIGVIGTDTSASTYPGHVIANAWVTSRTNGSGVLHYAVKNTAASNANTIKITWHVLWARQTDINGTYIS